MADRQGEPEAPSPGNPAWVMTVATACVEPSVNATSAPSRSTVNFVVIARGTMRSRPAPQSDRTVHISHKAIDPPGEANSDLISSSISPAAWTFVTRSASPSSNGVRQKRLLRPGRPAHAAGHAITPA
jgi:hypothetical protein